MEWSAEEDERIWKEVKEHGKKKDTRIQMIGRANEMEMKRGKKDRDKAERERERERERESKRYTDTDV